MPTLIWIKDRIWVMRYLVLVVILVTAAFKAMAQPVAIDTPKPAPEWALWQRHLLKEYWPASQEFVKRYTRPDGTLIWRAKWPGMDGPHVSRLGLYTVQVSGPGAPAAAVGIDAALACPNARGG